MFVYCRNLRYIRIIVNDAVTNIKGLVSDCSQRFGRKRLYFAYMQFSSRSVYNSVPYFQIVAMTVLYSNTLSGSASRFDL